MKLSAWHIVSPQLIIVPAAIVFIALLLLLLLQALKNDV